MGCVFRTRPFSFPTLFGCRLVAVCQICLFGGCERANAYGRPPSTLTSRLSRSEAVVVKDGPGHSDSFPTLTSREHSAAVTFPAQPCRCAIRNCYGRDYKCRLAIFGRTQNNLLQGHPSVADRKDS
jgi:hypothetical protein